MNKLIIVISMVTAIAYTSSSYNGSTTAPVILAGSIVKTTGADMNKKYPRKNCPVCKGTGKYISGDKISVVDCGYCDPSIKAESATEDSKSVKEDNTKCPNENCKCNNCKCKNCGCVPSIGK